MPKTPNALLHGSLDALILKTLAGGPRHGYAIAKFIEDASGDAVTVEEGSLYRPFTGWSGVAGSRLNGVNPSLGAGPSSIV
jgi:hypothetical protein